MFYKDNEKALFAYLMRMTGDDYLSIDIMLERFSRFYIKTYNEKE